MFISIEFRRYKLSLAANLYRLDDSCFSEVIHSPAGSPALTPATAPRDVLTLYTLIHAYETRKLYVPKNIAAYYFFLYRSGYQITEPFIRGALAGLDASLKTSFVPRYETLIIHHFRQMFGQRHAPVPLPRAVRIEQPVYVAAPRLNINIFDDMVVARGPI